MSKSTGSRAVLVTKTPIELCQFIKLGGVTQSGGEAKDLVRSGHVLLNDVVEVRKGKKLSDGDRVTVSGQTLIVKIG